MSLRNQIAILVLSLILAFVAAMGAVVAINRRAASAEELERASLSGLAQIYRFSNATKELLTSSQRLSEMLVPWNDMVTEVDGAIQAIISHPALEMLEESSRRDLQRAADLWSRDAGQRQRTLANLAAIRDDPRLEGFQKIGLLATQNRARQNQLTELVLAIDASVRDIEYADNTTSSLVAADLLAASAKIGTLAGTIRRAGEFMVLGIGILLIVISVVIVGRFGRRLTRKVEAVRNTLELVAQRDLACRAQVPGNDEFAAICGTINSTLEILDRFVGRVKRAVNETDELKEGLSAGASETTSAIHQIGRNIESIQTEFRRLDSAIDVTTEEVDSISDRLGVLSQDVTRQAGSATQSSQAVEHLNERLREVANVAEQRREQADELAEVLNESSEFITETSAGVKSVRAQIDSILEVIEIINAVAEQTNLLSMNAAIESAHAGEAGGGFAVVAEEIRNLAENTGENAARIEAMLRSITGRIQDAEQSSVDAVEVFEHVSEQMSTFSTAMQEISANVNEIETSSVQILAASKEIASTSQGVESNADGIAQAATHIRESMQTSRGLSSEVTQAMDEIGVGVHGILQAMSNVNDLSEQNRARMQSLTDLVDEFKTRAADEAAPEDAAAVISRS